MQIFFLRSWGYMICGCITLEKYFWQHSHKLEEMYAWVIYTGQFSRKSNFPLTRCILLLSFINRALTPLEKQKPICNRPEKCKETSARDSKPKFENWLFKRHWFKGITLDSWQDKDKATVSICSQLKYMIPPTQLHSQYFKIFFLTKVSFPKK